MDELTGLLGYQVPIWVLFVYWFLMAAISGLPRPKEDSGMFYQWFFSTAHVFSANVARATIGKKNGGSDASKTQSGTHSGSSS